MYNYVHDYSSAVCIWIWTKFFLFRCVSSVLRKSNNNYSNLIKTHQRKFTIGEKNAEKRHSCQRRNCNFSQIHRNWTTFDPNCTFERLLLQQKQQQMFMIYLVSWILVYEVCALLQIEEKISQNPRNKRK